MILVRAKDDLSTVIHVAEDPDGRFGAHVHNYFVRCWGWTAKLAWKRVNKKHHVPTCLFCIANLRPEVTSFMAYEQIGSAIINAQAVSKLEFET